MYSNSSQFRQSAKIILGMIKYNLQGIYKMGIVIGSLAGTFTSVHVVFMLGSLYRELEYKYFIDRPKNYSMEAIFRQSEKLSLTG